MLEETSRSRLTVIRVRAPDARDEQVWIQSSISQTHKLPRNHRDDFTFSRTDLLMISNRGEDIATLELECFRAGESGICIGSNRRGTILAYEGQGSITLRMKAGEVLTVRSIDALEPRGSYTDGDGNQRSIPIRTGQMYGGT